MTSAEATKTVPSVETLRKMLYYLKLGRESEWRLENVLYRQGKIVGGVYVGRGQEAVGVGAALTLRADDWSFPCHRDFAVYIIRGFTLADVFANWLARADSPNRGRDNTLHIGNLKLHIVPIISPLGANFPVACGAALVLKRRGKGNIVVAHIGEGTSSVGEVHEAMNFAAVLKLPVVFICNNNQYAYSTPVEKQYAVKSLAVRGAAYGMPGESVDGTDVLAVYDAVERAGQRARAGEGPTFLECVNLRMAGHSAHDAAEYVPEKLKQEWAKKDPIERLEKHLIENQIFTAQQLEEVARQVHADIDAAVAEAEARPMPRGEDVLKGVYCEPDCWWENPPAPGNTPPPGKV